jgi:hypothetical protein
MTDISQEHSMETKEFDQAPHYVAAPTPITRDGDDAPFSHGVFDSDPATAAARKGWLKISMFGVVVLCFMIWGVLPIYWAALGRSYNNIHNLSGFVVVRVLSCITLRFRFTTFLFGRTLTGAK